MKKNKKREEEEEEEEEEEKVCVNAECPLHPKDKEQQKAILYPADCFRSMLRPVTVRSLILG